MTVNHFVIVIKHMWMKNWHQYRHGRILVQDHAAYMLLIYSSARVGEYFESNMRRGSGRGLLYEVSGLILQSTADQESSRELRLCYKQTIDFVIFKNEKGEAEIDVRVIRDAKGFSKTPHKRLLHCPNL